MSTVWTSQPHPNGRSVRTEMLRLLGNSDNEVSKLRRVQLRGAPPVHLRLARSRRGIRTPVRKLSLLSDGLEGRLVGRRRGFPGHYLDHFVSGVPLMTKRAEPGAAPDGGRHTGFARHQALAAAPAGELWRSAALAQDQRSCLERALLAFRGGAALLLFVPVGSAQDPARYRRPDAFQASTSRVTRWMARAGSASAAWKKR